MAIQVKSDGQFSIEYEGPYLGLDVQKPETLISDKSSPGFNNIMLRNAELRSRPKLLKVYPGPTAAIFDLGISSFLDINGLWHVVLWAGDILYQLDPTLLPGDPWVGMVGAPGDLQTNPVSYRTFANAIWYTDVAFLSNALPAPAISGGGSGSQPTIAPFLAYWNGIDLAPVFTNLFSDASVSTSAAGISLTNSPTVGGSLPGGPTIVGPIAIGGGYLGELNNHLILANVSILDQNTNTLYNYPNLVWWSANGLPLQWDPTENTSAGFTFFLDVPDQITGLATIGIAGYLFRRNGITQFSSTGSAITPFIFDHMWASDHGIGNALPWSIAQYGPMCCFVAEDNIYALAVTNAKPIGGTARDAIMTDLNDAVSIPFACVTPKYNNGYVYMTYKIFIPFATFARAWVYSFEENNWASWDLDIPASGPFPSLCCAPNYV